MTPEEAEQRYGLIVEDKWAQEGDWCIRFDVPVEIAQSWINSATGKPTTHIYCNRDMAQALQKALEMVQARGLIHCLRTFDGCFNIRDVRGIPGEVSSHSYAIAIDINASTNRLGSDGDISRLLVKCFIDSGFVWGGDFHRRDPMHFSLGW